LFFTIQELQINFESIPPIEDDFEGIKMLLSQLWLKEPINCGDLAKVLMSQQKMCSVIRQIQEEDDDGESDDEDDEDDVLGVTSVIGLSGLDGLQDGKEGNGSSDGNECVSQIKEVIKKRFSSQKEDISSLDWSKVGLIINERFVNIPPRISLPIYQQLMEDLKQHRQKYDKFLLVIKMLKKKEKKPAEEQKNQSEEEEQQDIIYLNAEEELLDGLLSKSLSVEYSVANMCDSDSLGANWNDDDHLYEPRRKIVAIDWSVLERFVDKLKEEFK
jgi:protein BCP1